MAFLPLGALLFCNTAISSQPNIVLIMADDVSPEMFGCYGCTDAKTPNLDRMAGKESCFRQPGHRRSVVRLGLRS
jgi:hypothetical protein